jgi:lantibiotic modifying enzyme
MTALFAAERHEPLVEIPWNETRARDAIQSIVKEAECTRDSNGNWPTHPLDVEEDDPASGHKGLYLGSAGVVWALWYLQRQGAANLALDPAVAIERVSESYRADPDTGSVVPSYFLGEVGILLVAWLLTRSAAISDRIYDAVKANIPNPTNEALWGAPGTMLAAWHLWEATGEERWRGLFLENVEQLWRTWVFDRRAECYLWTQDLYGSVVQYLGAGHGFVGNAFALLKGATVLDDERRNELYDRCVSTLRVTKKVDHNGAVSWPPGTFDPRQGRPSMLMQWCHGAPGVVTAMADFPRNRSPEMDTMLLGAGNAIWSAGPLTKGYGLCHGTSGNGYAFLTLYERTSDPVWLERARSFAMHSLEQRARMQAHYGRGRHTLWTGDVGLAIYLWHCIRGSGGLPTLDFVE